MSAYPNALQPVEAAGPPPGSRIYLPLAMTGFAAAQPVLIGVYPPDYLGTQSAIDNNLKAIDQWTGKGISIAGLFLGFDDPNPLYNVTVPLELLWNNGYTAYVSLMSSRSAAEIARGLEDQNIHAVASAFAEWMRKARDKGQDRLVFLSPLPEANITTGNTYGGDPQAFQSSFIRIQDIFTAEFARRSLSTGSIKWVFAPNGWDDPYLPPFEDYYPGDQRVDVVAFSSYNFGYCAHWQYDDWLNGEELYKPVVDRMLTLAPGKPIFVGQTGSTAEYPRPNQYDPDQKDRWFVESYSYLANLKGVRAVLYFNIDTNCDWSFFRAGSLQFDGFRSAVSNPAYTYTSPVHMLQAFPAP